MTLSDAIREWPVAHPLIDLNSMKDVPEPYAWRSEDDMFADAPSVDGAGDVPVIDLSSSKLDVMNQLSRACEEWGAFQVVNHGIPSHVLAGIESEARRFFALPMEQKLKVQCTIDQITGYGLACISRFFEKMMWYEGFTIMGSPYEHARILMSSEDCERFCNVLEEYQREIRRLAEVIMELLLSLLGLMNPDDVQWMKSDKGSAQHLLNMNSYPVCPRPTSVMGLAAHTDTSLLTLLYQSNIKGLELLKGGKLWIAVPPITGAVIVNIGDHFHILSNGRFRSVLHRAIVNQSQHRYSFAYFWGPPPSAAIGPHPKLLSPISPPLYPSLSWQDYLKVKATHFNKALQSLQLLSQYNSNKSQNHPA